MTCALVLAAGQSRRMGTRKLLLPFAGTPIIARVVDTLLAAHLNTLIVIRPEDSAIPFTLTGRPVSFVHNPDIAGDMLSSIRCGLRALPSGTQSLLVCPGDQPSLTSVLISHLIAAYHNSARHILVPIYAGRRGHPLMFSTVFRDEILTRYDGVGLRGLLSAHPDQVCEWTTSDAAVLQDLDTPEDYTRACQALAPGASV